MHKIRWTGSVLLMLGLFAAPATAAVQDPAQGIPAAAEQSLTTQLARVGPGRFEVAFVDAAPEGAVGAAARLFATQGLGPDDVAIVVALGERRVGVKVGDGYRARGVDGRTIDRLVTASFAPRAAQGDYPAAVLALATALDRAARGGTPVPAGGGSGVPLWLIGVPLAVGAFFMVRSARARIVPADVGPRLKDLHARHGRALETALRLDEESRTARIGVADDDPDMAAYRRIDQDTTRLLGEASALSDPLTAAQAKPTTEAVAAIERRLSPLEAELAAVETALADVARPGPPDAALAGLTRAASELAQRLGDLQAAYEATRERAASLGVGGDPEVEGRLDAARRQLSVVPVDLQAGAAAIAEATEAFRRFETALDTAADRSALASQRQPGGLGLGGVLPLILMPPTIGGGFGNRSGYSDQGSFGGDGSSGGGSWDAGGSDDGGSGGGTW